MADLAVLLGVPREEGWDSVLLVTSPYHLERSLTLAEAAGVNVVGYAQARNPLNLWGHINAILHEYLTLALFYVSPG